MLDVALGMMGALDVALGMMGATSVEEKRLLRSIGGGRTLASLGTEEGDLPHRR